MIRCKLKRGSNVGKEASGMRRQERYPLEEVIHLSKSRTIPFTRAWLLPPSLDTISLFNSANVSEDGPSYHTCLDCFCGTAHGCTDSARHKLLCVLEEVYKGWNIQTTCLSGTDITTTVPVRRGLHPGARDQPGGQIRQHTRRIASEISPVGQTN